MMNSFEKGFEQIIYVRQEGGEMKPIFLEDKAVGR